MKRKVRSVNTLFFLHQTYSPNAPRAVTENSIQHASDLCFSGLGWVWSRLGVNENSNQSESNLEELFSPVFVEKEK